MAVRYFALLFGIVFLIVGAGGFIPGLNQMIAGDDANLMVEGPGHGMLLGLFHVNVLHNIVHILFGVWGLISYKTFDASRNYARAVGVAYILLTMLGALPSTSSTFGLIPIEGNNVWLHGLLGLAGAIFGFAPIGRDGVGATARM